MDQLIQSMLVAFGNNFTLYLKSHNFHWTVMGPDFPQYHSFLEGIYSDAQGSIDEYAEQLRRLGAFPQGDYRDIVQHSELQDPPETITDPQIMFENLLADLGIVILRLQDTYDMAAIEREYGLQNFLADRIDAHRKTQWMITAILGTTPTEATMGGSTPEGFNLASCPMALQDAKINLANHLTAIEEENLGPADPRQPETVFWTRKAELWGVELAQARTMQCQNCSHYIATTPMMECITKGPGGQILASALPITPPWADVSAPAAFCDLLDITCTATRTCDAWSPGGPIDDAKAAMVGIDPLDTGE